MRCNNSKEKALRSVLISQIEKEINGEKEFIKMKYGVSFVESVEISEDELLAELMA